MSLILFLCCFLQEKRKATLDRGLFARIWAMEGTFVEIMFQASNQTVSTYIQSEEFFKH